MVIRFFSQSETHREFSNFAPFPIDLDGLRWATTEHYYQAQKFSDRDLQTKIRKAEKPIIAKNLADKHRDSIRPDWEAVKDDVMYRAVRRKFELHPPVGVLERCCISSGRALRSDKAAERSPPTAIRVEWHGNSEQPMSSRCKRPS